MNRGLDSMMEFDQVVWIMQGGVALKVRGVHTPEAHIGTADDEVGSILDEHERALVADFRRQGWELETGWTGQQGDQRRSPLMHPSEFIGGRLEEHIRETPGLWVAVAVYQEDGESTGYWAVAHRESTDGAEVITPRRNFDPAPAGYDRIGLPKDPQRSRV